MVKLINQVSGMMVDMEWRIFKEWQRVCPEEPFYAYKYESIVKRAAKEKINIDNLKEWLK